MSSAAPACLIATDLDGTLLDDGYPLAEAALVIDSVSRACDAVVALVSSKTLPELVELAGHCVTAPLLVFENGAGCAWQPGALLRSGQQRLAGYEVESAGRPYAALRAELVRLRAERDFAFRGFGDMSSNEVARLTGLTATAAAQARDRAFSEPLLWQGDQADLERFRLALAALELKLVAGGRFLHAMPETSKAEAVARLRPWLRAAAPEELTLVCCGDAPNDLELLRIADIAVAFPDRKGRYLLPAGSRVIHAAGPGPARWLTSVHEALRRHSQEAQAS